MSEENNFKIVNIEFIESWRGRDQLNKLLKEGWLVSGYSTYMVPGSHYPNHSILLTRKQTEAGE